MWEVALMILCLGEPLEDKGNCQAFSNERGPYSTEQECMTRHAEMVHTIAPYFAMENMYFGPVAVLSDQPTICYRLGDDV